MFTESNQKISETLLPYYGRIINSHTHIYPEKIAAKATDAIGRFYDLPMKKVGLEEMLIKEMENFGIRHSFLLSTATVPSQVTAINDFLIDTLNRNGKDKFTAFGTVHPKMESPEKEIDRIRKAGITGLKFHHDFLGIAADDPLMDPIYEKAQADSIPIYLHAGDSRYHYTNPDNLIRISRRFPRLILIAAHFGGYSLPEEAAEKLGPTSFFFDTSSSLFALNPERAAFLLRKLGVDRFFFATDFPMWAFEDEWYRLISLRLSRTEMEQILYRNAESFLKLYSNNL